MVLASFISGDGSAEARPRLRRVVGEASRIVSAAFLRAVGLGDRRIVTAASLRVAAVLRVVAGFAPLRPVPTLVPVLVPLAARGLRVAAAGFSARTLRRVVVLAAVLRAVAVARGLLAAPRVAVARVGVLRPVDAVRAVLRFGVAAFAVRVEARAVDFAVAARPRVAGAAAVLRAGVLRAAAVRPPVLRVAAVLLRVAVVLRAAVVFVAVLAARVPEVLDAVRVGALAVLVVPRVAVDLPVDFLAAVERVAGALVVRAVRDVVLRPVVAAVRRPPARTAMARVLRPGVLSSSLLMMWSLPGGSAVI